MANSNLSIAITAKDRASKTLNDVGKSIGNMSAVSVVSAGAVAAFGASAIKAFSESEQAQLKLQDAFEKFPPLADTNIGALNDLNKVMQTKTKFDDEAYATAEASLAQYKLTGSQIKELTPLVADYAAKTGKDLTDAATTVGKALLGKGKALAEVGIKFKDAGSIEANYTQITQGLRTQVGGFAEKEGKTAAGQVEILKNQFNELQEKVGGALVPALSSLVKVVTPVATKVGEMSDATRDTVAQVALLGTAAALAGPKISSMVGRIRAAGTSATVAKVGVGGLTTALAVGALSVVNTSRQYDALIDTLQKAQEEFTKTGDAAAAESFKKSIFDTEVALKDLNRRKAEAEAADKRLASGDVGNYWKDQATQIGSARQRVADFFHQLTTGKTYQEDFTERLKESKNVTDRYNTIINTTADYLGITRTKVAELAGKSGIDMLNGSTGDVIGQLKLFNDAQNRTGTVAGSLKDKFVSARAALERYKDTLSTFKTKILDLPAAQDAANRSVDLFSQAIKDNGKNMAGNTVKAQANRQAARDVAQSYYDWAQKVLDTGGTLKEANTIIAKGRDRLGEMGRKAGLSKGEVDRLRGTLKLIPAAKSTTYSFKMDPTSKEYLDKLIGLVTPGSAANLRLKEERDRKTATGAGSQRQGRASGGPVMGGASYLIGERGPEVVTFGANGYVTPNHALGGTTIIVNALDPNESARAVVSAIKAARAQGIAV